MICGLKIFHMFNINIVILYLVNVYDRINNVNVNKY